MTKPQIKEPEGTFAVPRFTLDESQSESQAVQKLFNKIDWGVGRPRKDFLQYRFQAFCTIVEAVRRDKDRVVHTILNKSHYDISDWPIPYRAMKDVMDKLRELEWLVKNGRRRQYRNLRFKAPPYSPLLRKSLGTMKLLELHWEPPIVSIRRGTTDLDRAPLDVELMANAKWKAWIKKHLIPDMEDLNDKLLDHHFTFYPFGKANEYEQPQYQRIYTNISGLNQDPQLVHGRIYPQNFMFPSKERGWRQMTQINGEPTVEVDVHASSLTILSNDYYHGFNLPDTADLYQHGPLKDLNRLLVKKVTQTLINGVSTNMKQWPPSFKEDPKTAALLEGQKWAEYVSALISVYPTLGSLREHMGMELMWRESNIIIHAMNALLDEGIGCLSLHDCLIVPVKNEKDAKEAFYSAYESKGMGRPKLAVG
jgi:hypothetical protein